MDVYYYIFITLLGVLLGSFLNVVIYRLPKMMEHGFIEEIHFFVQEQGINLTLSSPPKETPLINLLFPHSFCPSCQHTLSWWQNIPLVSYLLLKARCFYCGVQIPSRYFLIEALTGLVLLACAYQFGITWQACWAMVFSLALIVLTFIDIDNQLLPDSITLPLTWLGLILSIFGIFVSANTAIIGACIGYLSLWSIYWVFKLITKKEGMGYGDFKLSAALGAWLGWPLLPNVLLIAALSGTVIAILLRIFKKLEPGSPIPFGPFLALSGWINLIWGVKISQFYFDLFYW